MTAESLGVFDLMAAARKYRAGGPGPKATLCALVERMGEHDGEWFCFPSMATVAYESEQDMRTVRRHVGKFEEVGLITRRARGSLGSRDGGRATNLFVLGVEVLMGGKPDIVSGVENGHSGRSDGGVTGHLRGGYRAFGGGVTGHRTHSSPHKEEPEVEVPETTRSPAAPEVRLCNLLADLVEANGSRRPTVSERWLTDCERMLRLDKRSFQEVERVLRWSQRDSFWRANILSMVTFRAQFDRLRLASLRETGSGSNDADEELRAYMNRKKASGT